MKRRPQRAARGRARRMRRTRRRRTPTRGGDRLPAAATRRRARAGRPRTPDRAGCSATKTAIARRMQRLDQEVAAAEERDAAVAPRAPGRAAGPRRASRPIRRRARSRGSGSRALAAGDTDALGRACRPLPFKTAGKEVAKRATLVAMLGDLVRERGRRLAPRGPVRQRRRPAQRARQAAARTRRWQPISSTRWRPLSSHDALILVLGPARRRLARRRPGPALSAVDASAQLDLRDVAQVEEVDQEVRDDRAGEVTGPHEHQRRTPGRRRTSSASRAGGGPSGRCAAARTPRSSPKARWPAAAPRGRTSLRPTDEAAARTTISMSRQGKQQVAQLAVQRARPFEPVERHPGGEDDEQPGRQPAKKPSKNRRVAARQVPDVGPARAGRPSTSAAAPRPR